MACAFQDRIRNRRDQRVNWFEVAQNPQMEIVRAAVPATLR
jgi:hypothetical protein